MKKIIFKVILNVALIFCIAYFIYGCIFYIQYLHETITHIKYISYPTIFRNFKYEILHIVFSIIAIIFNVLALVLIDIKGVSYLCSSAVKDYRERKEARKQKKIETLEKQLNDLKKDK